MRAGNGKQLIVLEWPKGVTAFGIQIQATGNSQKLRNHALKTPMQPGRALYARFTNKIYGRFQSILLL